MTCLFCTQMGSGSCYVMPFKYINGQFSMDTSNCKTMEFICKMFNVDLRSIAEEVWKKDQKETLLIFSFCPQCVELYQEFDKILTELEVLMASGRRLIRKSSFKDYTTTTSMSSSDICRRSFRGKVVPCLPKLTTVVAVPKTAPPPIHPRPPPYSATEASQRKLHPLLSRPPSLFLNSSTTSNVPGTAGLITDKTQTVINTPNVTKSSDVKPAALTMSEICLGNMKRAKTTNHKSSAQQMPEGLEAILLTSLLGKRPRLSSTTSEMEKLDSSIPSSEVILTTAENHLADEIDEEICVKVEHVDDDEEDDVEIKPEPERWPGTVLEFEEVEEMDYHPNVDPLADTSIMVDQNSLDNGCEGLPGRKRPRKVAPQMLGTTNTQAQSKPFGIYCEICNLWFVATDRLLVHLQEAHKRDSLEKVYYCTVPNCGEVFAAQVALENHFTTHFKLRSAKFSNNTAATSGAAQDTQDSSIPRSYVCQIMTCVSTCKEEDLNRHVWECHPFSKWSRAKQCAYCSFFSDIPKELEQHVHFQHSNEMDDICTVCDQNFPTPALLKAHSVIHSTKSPFQCLFKASNKNTRRCFRRFEGKDTFHEHLLLQHYPTKFQVEKEKQSVVSTNICGICDRYFSTAQGLLNHEKIKHSTTEIEIFSCEFCLKEFKAKNTLYHHIINIHEQEDTRPKCNICSICNKGFVSALSLEKHEFCHIKYNNSDKTLQCEICETRFYPHQKDKLLQHVELKHGKTPKDYSAYVFQCKVENCQFKGSASVFKRHEREKHPELLIHSCHLCNKQYSEESFLETHLLTHDQEGPFDCTLCTRGHFISPEKLAQHLAIHNGEPAYSCTKCSAVFMDGTRLRYHIIKAHDADSRFFCVECNAKFTTKTRLQNHIDSIHKNMKRKKVPKVKKHVCYFCGYRVSTFGELTAHFSTHTLERPYICHICHKDYTQYHCLTSHFDLHKKNGTFFSKPVSKEQDEPD